MNDVEYSPSCKRLPGRFAAGIKILSQLIEKTVQGLRVCLDDDIGILGGPGHTMDIAGEGPGDHITNPAIIQVG